LRLPAASTTTLSPKGKGLGKRNKNPSLGMTRTNGGLRSERKTKISPSLIALQATASSKDLTKPLNASLRRERMEQNPATLQRRDFYYKLAAFLVAMFDIICVEDLRVKRMAQGMLSKEIHDAGWGLFLGNILPYKAWRAGREVVKVKPNGTSQRCAVCGVDVPKDLTVRVHECSSCGFRVHRDINAALNILKPGLGEARRGIFLWEMSRLQEVAWFSESELCNNP